jgi:hypothetical protein
MSEDDDAVRAAFAEGMERWRKADQETREREFDRLARLSPGEYGIERGPFAEKWGIAVKFLDQEWERRRKVLFPKEDQTGGGQPLVLKDIEPADEPVDRYRVF